MKTKKSISIFIAVVMVALLFLSACSSNTNKSNEKLQIVTTIFPAYDWVKEVLGDNANYAELTMLLDNGVDLHSYQPTADDLIKISTCDMFVYVGGESDGWVEDALKNATNKDMVVINLMESLGDSVKKRKWLRVCRKRNMNMNMKMNMSMSMMNPLQKRILKIEPFLSLRANGNHFILCCLTEI